MATVKEAFLINPPKRLRRHSKRHVRSTHWRPPSAKALGGEGTRHRPVVYSRKGHWFTSAAARVAAPGHKLNPFRRRRKVSRNPFGAEGMLVGLNPRRSSMKLFGKHRVHHRNRKRHHKRNPRKHYRRNPIGSVMSYLPLVLGGAAGAVAVRYIPRVVGMTPGGLADYGVKLATIVGGGYVADKFISARAAEGWIIGSAAIIVTDLLAPVLGAVGLAGLGAFPSMSHPVFEGYGDDGMRYADNLEM